MEISDLIQSPQYSLSYAEKSKALLLLLKRDVEKAAQCNPHIDSWIRKASLQIELIKDLNEIPFLPVQMFKYFDLATVPQEKIVRVLKSSSTTSQTPSRIPLDKETGQRQTAGLATTLVNYLGTKRKIMLIFDHEGMNGAGMELTARGAGIRGLSIYAKKAYYILKELPDKTLTIDWDVLTEVCEKHAKEEVFGFGFTFIIWSIFCKAYFEKKEDRFWKSLFRFPKFQLFHSGGWKKLKDQSVSKKEFNQKLAQILNASPSDIRDFYGMAEQAGVIFIDCEYGFKHVPNFAAVIIRDPYTLKPARKDQSGLIQVLSALSTSYYGQSILTEDIGILRGIDDCPCGRKGERFHFQARVEKSEMRGCGDTFRPIRISV